MAIPKPLKRVADFEALGFGMFVHWGLYSQRGAGEWTFWQTDRNMEEYKRLKDSFTAEDFSAEELVLTAKRAGCRYITLTTRHHEGFSLYDTCGLSDFDAPHSPAKRDLVREFTEACHRHGILPFFYHTTLDWYNEDFNRDFDKYLEYLRQSVALLCRNYGKIGGFWFDGNWSRIDADWKEDALYATIRQYQPDAIIVNNTGLDARGALGNREIDSVTFEQGRPTPLDREGAEKYVAAEMCCTLNDHWGIGKCDFHYKSPTQLIENLCACRKAGANFLLNIGPCAQGAIHPFQRELMGLIGEWMKLYGEAIYRGRPHPARAVTAKDFVLTDGEFLYFFIHELAFKADAAHTQKNRDDGVGIFYGVDETLENVEWMDSGERLAFTQEDGVFRFDAVGYPYGMQTCVRVAKAKIKEGCENY